MNVPRLGSFLVADEGREHRSLRDLPVDSIEEILLAATALCERSSLVASGTSRIHPTATVHPTAVVEDSAIGPNVRVHEFTAVRSSVVLDGSTVGHGSEVVRSLMCSRSAVTHFGYLGDSVLGPGTIVGGAVRTANRRLDEAQILLSWDGQLFPVRQERFGAIVGANVRLGGSVHLNPGVMIGSASMVDPGLEIRHTIPPYSRVRRTFSYSIKPAL